jgi:hypothetical protein
MQGAQPAARSIHAAVAATFTEQKVNSAATCMGYCGAQCHCACTLSRTVLLEHETLKLRGDAVLRGGVGGAAGPDHRSRAVGAL